jgi:uncharacterized protein
MQRTILVSTLLAGLAAAGGVRAESPATQLKSDLAQICAAYEKQEVMVPMRDGVRLHTEIYRPKEQAAPTAIVLTRTPYTIDNPAFPCSSRLATDFNGVRDDGYILVLQHVRGRFESEGSFEMLGPMHHFTDPKAVDESTDAWDTVDWLVKNVPGNNGKVGLTGLSYNGWTTMIAALDPHPAVAAVSPQASPIDTWIGDDFWRNGAFRLNYAFEYVGVMELSKQMEPFAFAANDTFDWYLRQGALKNISTRIIQGKSRFWNEVSQHRAYDAYWSGRNFGRHLPRVSVPVLTTGGWWDAEDFYGPLQIAKGLRASPAHDRSTLVVGPWTHGGWNASYSELGRRIEPLDFGADTGAFWRQEVQRPWLAHWLLGKPAPDLPRVLSFRTGSNQWQRYDAWPPKPARGQLNLSVGCDGTIALGAGPAAKPCRASYVSDPANPVPYLPRPIGPLYVGKGFDPTYKAAWSSWQAQDQRFSANRPDTLLFATAPLTEEVVLTGEAELTLHIATSGTDGDFIVKLLDIYPPTDSARWAMGGYHLMLDHVVVPGRYLESSAAPRKLQPGRVYTIKVRFTGNDHAFLPGHRLALQVQSTLFPVIARNPQRYVENLFEASDSDFQPARVEIVFGPGQPNSLVLPRN